MLIKQIIQAKFKNKKINFFLDFYHCLLLNFFFIDKISKFSNSFNKLDKLHTN